MKTKKHPPVCITINKKVSAYLDPYIKASDGAMIIPHLNSLLARVTDAEVARALCRFGAEFNLITKGDAWMKDGKRGMG